MTRFMNSLDHHYLQAKPTAELLFLEVIIFKRYTTQCARNTQKYAVHTYVAYGLSA
jgi:hypothetical protein